MSVAVKITIAGDKQLLKQLRHLSRTGARRAARKALMKAATPVLKATRAAAPRGPTGNLKRGQRKRYDAKEGRVKVIQAPHAHLLEFGTKPRYTKKPVPPFGRFRGRMPAKDIIVGPAESAAAAATASFAGEYKRQIEIEARKTS